MEMVYSVSKKEINRRINAYTALIVSFYLVSIVFSINYIILYFNIFKYIIFIVGILLFISRVIVIKYLNRLQTGKVILNSKYLIKNEKKFLVADIKKATIKIKTDNKVREIKLVSINNQSTYLNNSINDVEKLFHKLHSYLPKSAITKTIHEPLDFDHPLFYIILGLLLGFSSVTSINVFINLKTISQNMISIILAIISIALGLYFIIYKPIYKRDEKKKQYADYIWGLFFIISAIVIFIMYL